MASSAHSYFICSIIMSVILYASLSSAQPLDGRKSMKLGSSLSPQRNQTVLLSPDATFSAGFSGVGDNAYSFGIWYSYTPTPHTLVWMANRDQPVNGKNSRLHLQKDGDLIICDAGRMTVWRTNTRDRDVKDAELLNTGNLVLRSSKGHIVWQSFDYPTDTLLPHQRFTKDTQLVSRMGVSSYKSGYYRFHFNEDNFLVLIYQGFNLSSRYWPHPWLNAFQNDRTTYNVTRVAVLDAYGGFGSTDQFSFNASDYGKGPLRRLTMDSDGNLRLYSLDRQNHSWTVSWIAMAEQCRVHGLCGVNGLCIYAPQPKCVCPPGFKMADPTDWFKGCHPIKKLSCGANSSLFFPLPYTDYYGYDIHYGAGMSFEECRKRCMDDCSCLGFGYILKGTAQCFPKAVLTSGYRSPGAPNHMYIKISSSVSNESWSPGSLDCSHQTLSISSSTVAKKGKRSELVIILACFVSAIGVTEIACIALGWWFMHRNDADFYNLQGYFAIPGGLQRFTFSELRRATNNFKDVVGKGGFGTVYKGFLLPDNKMVAVKRLEGVVQGQDQFWAEVSMIGKVNHMNLVRMFGFCAEEKHRLLVYEYVENGSLDRHLFGQDTSRVLDWNKRFQIAVGTAKALAYLHEECLEWILHCDIKPQNILLDEQFRAKVSDFGLAKLVEKSERDHGLAFSTVRGTRGYMAPEWTMNLPITAKADVYSFGILLLELVSGQDAAKFNICGSEGINFVQWACENVRGRRWKENLVDSKLQAGEGEPEVEMEMEMVLNTALVCVEQDKDRRPSMREVVEMLTHKRVKEEEEKEKGSLKVDRVLSQPGMSSSND